MSLKKIGHIVLGSAIVRGLVCAIMTIGRQFGRVASKAKLLSLAPHATNVICHWSVDLKYPKNVEFGDSVVIGPHCTLGAFGGIKLGSHVRLSKGVAVETAGLDLSTPPPYRHTRKSIVIDDGTWVGAGAIILGGVTIGRACIIGAGAVVTRDVPAESVVTGSAMTIRPRRQPPSPVAQQGGAR